MLTGVDGWRVTTRPEDNKRRDYQMRIDLNQRKRER